MTSPFVTGPAYSGSGVWDGHFDVDTDSSVAGDTDGHIHEYDYSYDLTGINCF